MPLKYQYMLSFSKRDKNSLGLQGIKCLLKLEVLSVK